jgi:hypothetical protein
MVLVSSVGLLLPFPICLSTHRPRPAPPQVREYEASASLFAESRAKRSELQDVLKECEGELSALRQEMDVQVGWAGDRWQPHGGGGRAQRLGKQDGRAFCWALWVARLRCSSQLHVATEP